MIRILLMMALVIAGLSSCASLKKTPAESATLAQPSPDAAVAHADAQPAQAQTGVTESALPATSTTATEFSAAAALPAEPVIKKSKPDALASINSKIVSETWQKPLGLSKVVLKMAEKQVVKAIKKRRPAQQDGTILGLRPVLFFALIAVLAGVVLLFVAGKSQFFSILTLVLLIAGLLVSLAAFLDLI